MGGHMSERRCAMAPMVEAARDGRLDARDQASLARHLGTCAECRALEVDLELLRELAARPLVPPATPLEHQRGRVALLNASVAMREGGGPASPRAGNRLAVALVGAVTLAAAAGVWIHERSSAHAPALARTFPPLPRPAGVAPGAPSDTTVESATGARFTRTRGGSTERVQLDEGSIDLRVRRLAEGERFVVATGDAEVQGTAFHVEARDRHIAAVSVAEGKVEVRYAGVLILLDAGQSWAPPAAAAEPAPPVAASGSTPAGAPRVASIAEPRRRPAGAPRDPASTASSAAAGGGGAQSNAFVEGMAAVARGDYAAGAEKLDAYRAANPGDARAADAAYMAVLALQRAGRREAAAAAATRYLEAYPDGNRRAEMQAIARAAASR
jgi:TolA-binding protein